MMIREVVREEIRLGLKEILGEVKQPQKFGEVKQPQKSQPKQKPKKKYYSKNKVLNDVLNETAIGDRSEEWETMGGNTYTSDKMNEIMGRSYANMMNDNQQPNADTVVRSMGGDPNTVGDKLKNALTRDYSDLMKAINKKK